MHTIAAGAGTVLAGGYGAFKYNRENYLYDMATRYGRFTAGFSFAAEQAEMYREDIHDLTDLTTSKQDMFHALGVIFLVLCFQTIMAGRLGVHGPAPPGWLLGMYWINIGSALMFICISTWLSMHASARATAGSVYMLTHRVRLPIPTPAQLDKARAFGNSFERTSLIDMFRVPFAMPCKKDPVSKETAKADQDAASASKDGKTNGKKAAPTKVRRAPFWYRDENKDLHMTGTGPVTGSSVPEHFEAYRSLQQEWWSHDIYARISLLYFFQHWINAISLYSQSHCFGELRALWPAWTVTIVFAAGHYLILSIDIVPDNHVRYIQLPIEKVAPVPALLCVLGMSLDYAVIPPSVAPKVIIYLIAAIAYVIHILWAIRMYELACPYNSSSDPPDMPGQPWWPAEWWLPGSFSHALYLVAPPKHLEPGQNCLQLEMKAGLKGRGASTSPRRRMEGPGFHAWRIFRGAMVTNIAMWVLMIVGRVIDLAHGERQFLKQEGRVMRWPSHMQPWITPWTREGSRNEWAHTGGADRRLGAETPEESLRRITGLAQRLERVLDPLADKLDTNLAAAVVPQAMRAADVGLPAEFRPAVLACRGEGSIAAVSGQSGEGAVVRSIVAGGTPASPFALHGLEGLGEVLGVSWGDSGLVLTTSIGAVLECAGEPPQQGGGAWKCTEVGTRLPLGGVAALHRAVAGRDAKTGRLRAAVALSEDPGLVLLDADDEQGSWLPAGEVQLEEEEGASFRSLSMSPSGDELYLAAGDGGVLRWPLGGGVPLAVPAPMAANARPELDWQAACSLGNNRLAHLGLRSGGLEAPTSVRAELFFSEGVRA